MNAVNKDLNRIKVVLAEQKRTQRWLAKELNVTPATVSRWCINFGQPSIEMLSEIAKSLNIDIRELLNPSKS